MWPLLAAGRQLFHWSRVPAVKLSEGLVHTLLWLQQLPSCFTHLPSCEQTAHPLTPCLPLRINVRDQIYAQRRATGNAKQTQHGESIYSRTHLQDCVLMTYDQISQEKPFAMQCKVLRSITHALQTSAHTGSRLELTQPAPGEIP